LESSFINHSMQRRPVLARYRAREGVGKSGEREAGSRPQRSGSERRWRLAENQTRHAIVPSESEMRHEAIGAVAGVQLYPESVRVRLSRECGSAPWVITTRASFWVCRCRWPRLARRVIGSHRRVSTCGIVTRRVPLRVGHGS
jgi:hypothetical protein